MSNKERYKSSKTSLNDLLAEDGVSVKFNIPIYQRLYVWGEQEIKRLLEDILDSNKKNKDQFIGTVVLKRNLVESNNQVITYDLVDGQQRFTTLWLLSLLFDDNRLGKFTTHKTNGKVTSRLVFSIRDKVTVFFNKLYNEIESLSSELSFIDRLQKIKSILSSITTDNKLNQLDNDLNDKRLDNIREGLKSIIQVLIEHEYSNNFDKDLSTHVFKRVQFISVKIPKVQDLNKLFEILNNRGVQLLQEDIVKASLISNINDNEKDVYNQLWTACSVMNEYFENVLKTSIKNTSEVRKMFEIMFDENSKNKIARINEVMQEDSQGNGNSSPNSLSKLLSSDLSYDEPNNVTNDQKDENKKHVESIISFPQLILHTLRIYDLEYHKEDLDNTELNFFPGIDENKLIEVFQSRLDPENSMPIKATKFIEILFRTRFVFDLVVLKWVEQGADRQLKLKRLQVDSKNYLTRDERENDSLQLLQRMLYHTQDPRKHNWLTPFLYHCIKLVHKKTFDTLNFEEVFKKLEYIDNLMFCCSDWNKERANQARILCLNNLKDFASKRKFDIYEDIQKQGLKTPHYWFYKIDLLLFRNVHREKDSEGLVYPKRIGNWDKFKMTSRNSIEHVLPRDALEKKSYSEREEKLIQYSIGNLALVTTTDNSTYNARFFTEKANTYENLNGKIPSTLKLDWIYGKRDLTWEVDDIKSHAESVKKLLSNYFSDF